MCIVLYCITFFYMFLSGWTVGKIHGFPGKKLKHLQQIVATTSREFQLYSIEPWVLFWPDLVKIFYKSRMIGAGSKSNITLYTVWIINIIIQYTVKEKAIYLL